jgi:hypothetical protein
MRLPLLLVLAMASLGCTPTRTIAAPAPGDSVMLTCRVDADCAVKNVGNCCGYYPACVNRESPVFPERVKAECLKKGMSSICGFPDITACTCTAGRCEAAAPATE